MTVPETDTGGWVENTKALERTRVKELASGANGSRSDQVAGTV